jgi:hypothetical protein
MNNNCKNNGSISNAIYQMEEIEPLIKGLKDIVISLQLNDDSDKSSYYKVQSIEKIITAYKNIIFLSHEARQKQKDKELGSKDLTPYQIRLIRSHHDGFLNFANLASFCEQKPTKSQAMQSPAFSLLAIYFAIDKVGKCKCKCLDGIIFLCSFLLFYANFYTF